MKALNFIILVFCCPLLLLAQSNSVAESHFNQGMAAMNNGRYSLAKDQFREALKLSPKASRIRLELALAEEKLGNTKEAKKLYQEVLSENPPSGVRKNVEARLAALSSSGEGAISNERYPEYVAQFQADGLQVGVSLASGFFYDDNVNAGPSTDTVFIFNLPFALSEGAQAQSDYGYQVDANLSYFYSLTESFGVVASLGYSRIAYFEFDRFNYDSLRVSIGPQWSAQKYRFTASTQYHVTWLGGELYTQSAALVPSLEYYVSKNISTTTYVYGAINTNEQVGGRSGSSLAAGHSIRFMNNSGTSYVQPRLFYGREFASSDAFSSHQAGAGLGFYSSDLPGGFYCFVEPSFRYTIYDDAGFLVRKIRKEPQLVVNANVGHKLPWWDLDAALGYTFTSNFANTLLYKYNRNQVTFVIRKGF